MEFQDGQARARDHAERGLRPRYRFGRPFGSRDRRGRLFERTGPNRWLHVERVEGGYRDDPRGPFR